MAWGAGQPPCVRACVRVARVCVCVREGGGGGGGAPLPGGGCGGGGAGGGGGGGGLIAHLASDALDAWDLGLRSVKLVLHELQNRVLAVRDADVANVVVACR